MTRSRINTDPDGLVWRDVQTDYVTVMEASGAIAAGAGAATRYLDSSGAATASGSGVTVGVPMLVLSGTTDINQQALNLYVALTTTATQTGVTFQFGLYPVTVSGTTTIIYTVGTVVAGSTVSFVAPATAAESRGNSGDFTFPANDMYVIGVNTNASTAALSTTGFHCVLRAK